MPLAHVVLFTMGYEETAAWGPNEGKWGLFALLAAALCARDVKFY
jgi:hypothetical protein